MEDQMGFFHHIVPLPIGQRGAGCGRGSNIRGPPRVQDVRFGGCGECGDIGETLHPSYKIRDHSGDCGLLQHELGDEHGVGSGGRSPWELAPMGAEPSAEGGVKIGSHGIGYHLDTHEGLRSKIGNVFTKSTAFPYRRAHARSGGNAADSSRGRGF